MSCSSVRPSVRPFVPHVHVFSTLKPIKTRKIMLDKNLKIQKLTDDENKHFAQF